MSHADDIHDEEHSGWIALVLVPTTLTTMTICGAFVERSAAESSVQRRGFSVTHPLTITHSRWSARGVASSDWIECVISIMLRRRRSAVQFRGVRCGFDLDLHSGSSSLAIALCACF
ncbi:unnamed protein product [Heligmosomoides polygyrus]|uniref:Secreted protein n=1 Tax=Heligmosomoides polygyrus TaxID=6339 RepID=A0A183FIR5_HELPZ|nr:unnamed protein product [Heligmosomoides polygyrus]